MENIKTFDQCCDEVANRYGYKKWSEIDFYAEDCKNQVIESPFAYDKLIKESAELFGNYCSINAWERGSSDQYIAMSTGPEYYASPINPYKQK